MNRSRIVSTSAAVLTAASFAFFGSSSAKAQQAAPANAPAWNGYSPGYAWGSAAPSVGGYAPQARAPRFFYRTPSGTAWQGYAPGTAWQGYAPAANAPTVSRPAAVRPSISSSNREYGTGRNVHMHKPWLPSKR